MSTDSIQLSQQEIESFTAKFHSFDTNGDSFISLDELRVVEESFDMKPTQEQLEREIKSVDIDADGRINLDEFLVMMAQQKAHDVKEEEKELKQLFDELDQDNNGFIDETELKYAIVTELGEDRSDEDIEDMMNKADEDLDGLLNYSEFVEMILKNKEANARNANEDFVMKRVTNTINDELHYVLLVSVIVIMLLAFICGIVKIYNHFKYKNARLYEALAVECVTVDDDMHHVQKAREKEPELQAFV